MSPRHCREGIWRNILQFWQTSADIGDETSHYSSMAPLGINIEPWHQCTWFSSRITIRSKCSTSPHWSRIKNLVSVRNKRVHGKTSRMYRRIVFALHVSVRISSGRSGGIFSDSIRYSHKVCGNNSSTKTIDSRKNNYLQSLSVWDRWMVLEIKEGKGNKHAISL